MLTYVCGNNKASLVNMLVILCGKLECSFLTAAMLLLYLHFSTTAKVPLPETLRKLLTNFLTKGYERQQKVSVLLGFNSVSEFSFYISKSWSGNDAFVI